MLTSDGHTKLVDFGLAVKLRSADDDVKAGTLSYWPPEVYE